MSQKNQKKEIKVNKAEKVGKPGSLKIKKNKKVTLSRKQNGKWNDNYPRLPWLEPKMEKVTLSHIEK